jgi:serine phosphatase RsbU (regulator of sigma subunit)
LGSKLVDANYSSDEKKLIATLVNNMVVALQNAGSFEEIKNLNQDLLENKKKLETTLEKLRVAVRANAGLESEGIRSAIIDAVMKFRGKAPQEDDITLVVLKFL